VYLQDTVISIAHAKKKHYKSGRHGGKSSGEFDIKALLVAGYFSNIYTYN
jgi:hypothetical protein